VGWAIDSTVLKSLRPALPPMRPDAAAGLILSGAALWIGTRGGLNRVTKAVSLGCALTMSLLGLAALIEHIFHLEFEVNGLLFQAKLEAVNIAGRLPALTAICFLLSGGALATLHVETRRASRPAQFLAIGVMVICLLTLVSYGYGIPALNHLNPDMAVLTAVAFIILSAAVLSAYPNRGVMAVATSGGAGGFMLRRLMLAGIAGPSLLGWLNIAGTDAGLYTREVGTVMYAAANVVLFLIVLWRNAQLLHLMDAERQQALSALRESYAELESRVYSRTEALTDANDALRAEITERRRVAEQLRRSQEDLADFFENATVGLHWVGSDGIILRANRAELNMLGYTKEEYIGHDIAEFHADPNVIKDILRKLASNETLIDYPAKLKAKDGSLRQVLINSNVLWEGDRFIHTRCFTRDMTDAKQIERERNQLLLSEQAARSEAEHAAETIRRLQSVTDTALSHLGLDELLREMLGRTQDLLAADAAAILLLTEDGKYLAGRMAIGIEEEARVRVPMGRGLAGRIAVTREPIVVDDLSKVEVVSSILIENVRSLVGAPLMIEGRVIGVIHVDTLESHNFSADDVKLLQLAADRIAMAIERARLYEAEQQARLEAEMANRMKDDFLATISHELRSPLNSILGWVLLLREGRLSEDATTAALKTVERSARAQDRLIGDLLDVSGIVNGQLRLRPRALEPAPVIEAAVQAQRPAAEAKGIDLKMSLDFKAGEIYADSDRLQQIVGNLVSNAIKFTPSAGLVEIRLQRVATHVELAISDTGEGISGEFLPFVFDRFRQADSSSTRKQGGLGLGLAIVRHLVTQHGGTVSVKSEGIGRGAVFTVELPLMDCVSAADENRFQALSTLKGVELDCPPALDGLRVLVVDDESNVRDLVSAILTESDADVRVAASAAEVLRIFEDSSSWRPDVLIADIEMPVMDGYELLRQVRTLPAECGGRVLAVALSTCVRAEDRLIALEAGFQMHMPKPVEPAELLTVLASVTGRLARSTGPLLPL